MRVGFNISGEVFGLCGIVSCSGFKKKILDVCLKNDYKNRLKN